MIFKRKKNQSAITKKSHVKELKEKRKKIKSKKDKWSANQILNIETDELFNKLLYHKSFLLHCSLRTTDRTSLHSGMIYNIPQAQYNNTILYTLHSYTKCIHSMTLTQVLNRHQDIFVSVFYLLLLTALRNNSYRTW